jgi:hypothetical protein
MYKLTPKEGEEEEGGEDNTGGSDEVDGGQMKTQAPGACRRSEYCSRPNKHAGHCKIMQR